MSTIANLKEDLKSLEGLTENVKNADDVAQMFNNYWPKIKEVLTVVKNTKLTGKRADKKLEKAIESGDSIYNTTSNPAELDEKLKNISDLLDEIDDKVDKVISVLSFVEKFAKEKGVLDNVLDKTISFLTGVSKAIETVDEKIQPEDS